MRFFLCYSGSSLTSPEVNRDISKRTHPPALRPFLPEIAEFARHNHEEVLHQILRSHFRFLHRANIFNCFCALRLLALGLELPEDTLVNLHNLSAVEETSGKLIGLHKMQFSFNALYHSALHEIVRPRGVLDDVFFPKPKVQLSKIQRRGA